MDQGQEQHLCSIKETFCNMVDKKYRQGAAEHGGFLPDIGPLTLLDCAIDEAIDQVTYLLTLREELRELLIDSNKED